MSTVKPLEVTVGRGTPVHIHVTRDPLTRAQSLEQTLVNEQRARAAQRAGHELADVTSKHAQIKVKTRKEAFHPPPCQSQRPHGSLRSGISVGHAAPSDERRRVHYDATDDASAGGNFDKQLHHYRSQVDQMADTVSGLRDTLEHERGARALREQEELLGRYRRELAANTLEQRRDRDRDHAHADDSGSVRSSLVQQLAEVEATNKLLRKLLVDIDNGAGPASSTKRDEILKKIGELEATNRRLREQLSGREQEVENLSGKVAHTERLQQSFEELKASMKKTKARLEGELKDARQQVCDRDEEINRLLCKHSSANTAVSQLKGVIDTLKTNAARETAALKGVNKELKHQLRQAEAAIDELKARAASSVAAAQQAAQEATEAALRKPCERCPGLSAQLHAYQDDEQRARAELATLATEVENTNQRAHANHAKAQAQAAEIVELRRKLATFDELTGEVSGLRAALAEQRATHARAEQAAAASIRALEADLHNALAVKDALDQHLKESQRKAKATEFDLREKLDYAGQSTRHLSNYVGYVKGTVADLADHAGAAGAASAAGN